MYYTLASNHTVVTAGTRVEDSEVSNYYININKRINDIGHAEAINLLLRVFHSKVCLVLKVMFSIALIHITVNINSLSILTGESPFV